MKNLTKRVLMGLWGIPLILGLSYLGGYYFLAFSLIVNSMALWEFYTIFQRKEIYPYRFVGLTLSNLLILVAFWLPCDSLFAILIGVMIVVLLRHLLFLRNFSSANTMFTMGGVLYISVFLITLLKLRQNFGEFTHSSGEQNTGGMFLVLLWLSIWICDTFAYFGGKQFGKHKLAPKTSPNKTVEGGIFGFVSAILTFVILGKIFLPNLTDASLLISGLIVGIWGQVGDLVESRFKRDAGVKDTSTILPGHGGFLDRFDSIIFVSPFFYLFFKYLYF
ncbi:MAG: phosphatidate cytidylyltransferase [Calditrichia bacterium]